MGVLNVNATAVAGFELLYLGLTSDNALSEGWFLANGPSTNKLDTIVLLLSPRLVRF